jgi:hypothetical protein
MDLKQVFVALASEEGANRRELCRASGSVPRPAIRLGRFDQLGVDGLVKHSRRPASSPKRTDVGRARAGTADKASGVGRAQDRRPPEGLRRRATHAQHHYRLRHGVLYTFGREPVQHTWQRFQREAPYVLWQMDFKGDFEVGRGRCCTLRGIDDHSRYNLTLQGRPRTDSGNVRERLSGSTGRSIMRSALTIVNARRRDRLIRRQSPRQG